MQHPKTTAERIDDLVQRSGKSLSVVASEIGVSPSLLSEIRNKEKDYVQQATSDELSTMSEYKKRDRNIGSANLIKICNYFDVSSDYILCLSDVQTRNETIQGINQITGLSESAIAKLRVEKSVGDFSVSDFISYLISSEHISELKAAIQNRNIAHSGETVFLDNQSGADYEVETRDMYGYIVNILLWKILDEYQPRTEK